MNSKIHVLTGIAGCAMLTFTAMTGRANDTGSSTNSITAPPLSPYQPFTIGVEAGTTGAGGSANWRFANHFGIGGSFDYFRYSYGGTIENINFDARLRLMSESAILNIYPWKKSSFHISVGALFNENHLSGTAGGTITINGTTYNNATASLDIKPQVVDPYVGIGGNLYFDKRRHVSLGAELGVAYTGTPRVSFAMPAATSQDQQYEQDKIHSYAKDLQFWPVVKVSLNFSF